ncbi:hypothetical protein QR680_019249 [Steinernema hermaphroditum]|uniref:Peptidase C1A papain C-terminal domain-containing protein n=1 Tax=Steinernema hermaphroditum TaxID=289476 RepID=A0AA39LRK6_9BILA|nr:hypothetical protein QR680_019249 [Steinernema hermaphroditum]
MPVVVYGSTDRLVDSEDVLARLEGINDFVRSWKNIISLAAFAIIIVALVVSGFIFIPKLFEPDSSRNDTLVVFQEYLISLPERVLKERGRDRALEQFENVLKTLEFTAQLNSRSNYITFEVNRFADWNKAEIQKLFRETEVDWNKIAGNSFFNTSVERQHIDPTEPPPSKDWRKENVLTPVKHQGYCSSGWAFATTALVEAAVAISTKSPPVSLSEQQLMDCDYFDRGCYAGNVLTALTYVKENGLTAEEWYPYNPGLITQCQPYEAIAWIKEFSLHKFCCDPWWLEYYGPMVVTISVTKEFISYKSGIFHPLKEDCEYRSIGRHSMLVVGKGISSDGTEYWILRNSLGRTWGEDGYMRFIKGINACGIEDSAIGARL